MSNIQKIENKTNALARLVESEKICTAVQREGTGPVKTMVHAALFKRLNTIAETEVIADFTNSIVEMFDGESIEDMVVFCQMIHAGRFGKVYGKLDSPTLGAWWSEYLDKKYEAIEQAKIEESSKHKDKGVNFLHVTNEKGESLAEVLQKERLKEQIEKDEAKEKEKSETWEMRLEYLKENIVNFTDQEVLTERGRLLAMNWGADDMIKIYTDEMLRRGL